jgi:hypothetical protein
MRAAFSTMRAPILSSRALRVANSALTPYRVRQFKLSNDQDFVAKVRDALVLYVEPPAHAITLSVDEKSQIQALDAPSRACR